VGVAALAAAEAPGDGGRDAARLTAQLGSDSFAQREAAARALDQLGAAALPWLRQALADPDAEVRRRAAELIDAIEQRELTRRLLAPQKVRLHYKGVPVAVAVGDFSRRTGGQVLLAADVAKLGDRTVTLDAGELPYWEALARLCEAAGLHEQRPAPPAPPRPERGEPTFGRGKRVVFLSNREVQGYFKSDDGILLADGKAEPPPTALAGALRIRALPPEAASADPARGDRQVAITLELKPEPQVSWEGVAALRIDRALDDQGQTLSQPAPYVGRTELIPNTGEETILIVDGDLTWPTNRGPRQAPVQLLLGERPSKSLRELRGTVAAWVRTPPEELLAVTDVLKAEGRPLGGSDGSTVRVDKVKDDGDGLYRILLQVDEPPPLASLESMTAGRILMGPRGPAVDKVTVSDLSGASFRLLDEGGKPLALLSGHYRPENNGMRKIYSLEFRAARGQGPPARLVYVGPRNALVETSFVLKDVPLVKAK
jgi:hypothetical protein